MAPRVETMSIAVPLRSPSPGPFDRQRHRGFGPLAASTSANPVELATARDLRRRSLATPSFWVYESKGNYEADAAALEDPSLPLNSAQDSLPRLPVPSLEDTCRRFLPTALPLATSEAEASSLREAVAKFPSQACALQKRLEQRAETHSSWLQEWWNTMGYLQVRDPIVVHVSYFFRNEDDPKLKRLMQQQNQNANATLSYPPYQPCVARSAALLPAAIRYAQTILSNQTEPATIGHGDKQATLCSAQCKYMFQACRIPQKGSDIYRMYYNDSRQPPQQQQPQHIVIACRGQFFAVNVDRPLSQSQWRRILHHCIDQTKARNPNSSPPSLGWLTGMQRDKWAAAREILLQQGGAQVEEALTCLESSLFLICLDVDDEIRSDRDRGLHFWHGRGDRTSSDYHNRWHDKSVEIMVLQDGTMGFQGEHSMVDGVPNVEFCNTMVHEGTVEEDCLVADNGGRRELPRPVINIFEEAFASLSPAARSHIDTCVSIAQEDFLSLTSDYEMHVQNYIAYGRTVMKKAGCSPDAYMQMAMQLANYRMFGEQLATYEATQVKRFLHGRTETTRSISPASLAFCQAMTEDYDRAHRYKLLQEACNSHAQYIRSAAHGQGVDRHFLGLSLLTEQEQDEPDLFSHPLFAKSKHYRLSTSSLPNMALGFGPVVNDGLGIGYEPKPDSCYFHISARKEHGWTEDICAHLAQALDDMRRLYDLEEDNIPPRTRL